MSLHSLEATDFCCFPKLSLRLRKRGLVWIGGQNNDTESANSNGSGKSTIFKAVGWAAYGRSVDGADGDEVIRHGQKGAQTKLKFVEGYEAVRERRKGAGKLKLFRGEEEVLGSKEEIQAQVDRLMGMDWQTFRNVAMYGQRDTKRFVHPDTTDRERKEVLGRILNTGIYGVAHTWIKEQALKHKKSAERAESEREKAQARIDEYDLDALKAERDEWETLRKARVGAKGDQARTLVEEAKELLKEPVDVTALETRLSQLREQQRAIKTLEADMFELETVATKLRQEQFEASTKETVARRAMEAAEKAHDKVVADGDGVCPLCTGSLKTGGAAAHVAELVADLESKKKAHKSADKLRTAATEAADAKHAELRRARAALKVSRDETEAIPDIQQEIADAKAVAASAASKREQAKLALEAAQAIKAEANPVIGQIERAKERLKKARDEIAKADAELVEIRSDTAHVEFWQKGFSPSGMPSFALDAVMPMITEYANKYLKTLSDGDITLEFGTQRELKSAKGEYRDEISLSWEIEGIKELPPSGGQWKKMEIATNFALMDLVASQEGASSSILLLDEVFDGLDAEGVDRVGILLQKMRVKRDTIMVISHSASMQEWFERAIIVDKSDGASLARAA